MKLTSLKLSPKEAKTEIYDGPASPGKDKGPRYPYGTRITLDTESLEKLKLDVCDYKTGEELEVTCTVEVIGTSTRQRQGGDDRNELELQITEIAIGESKAKKKQRAADKHLESISGPTKTAEAAE